MRNAIVAIGKRAGRGGLEKLVAHYDDLIHLGVRGADIARVAKNGGGGNNLDALKTHFAALQSLLVATDMNESEAAQEVVALVDHNGGSRLLANFAARFHSLRDEAMAFEPAEILRTAKHDGGGKVLETLISRTANGPSLFERLQSKLVAEGFPSRSNGNGNGDGGVSPDKPTVQELISQVANRDGGTGALEKLEAYLGQSPASRSKTFAQDLEAMVKAGPKLFDAIVAGLPAGEGSSASAPRHHKRSAMAMADQPETTARKRSRPNTMSQDSGAPAAAPATALELRVKQGTQVSTSPQEPMATKSSVSARTETVAAQQTGHATTAAATSLRKKVLTGPAALTGAALTRRIAAVSRRIKTYRPELNRRFFARDLSNPANVDPRFALAGDPGKVDPDWVMDELTGHPEHELHNSLVRLPVLDDDRLYRKYSNKQERDAVMEKRILPAVRAELAATRKELAPPGGKFCYVDTLNQGDMSTHPRKLLGRVGDRGLFANLDELKRRRRDDFVVLGLYAGAGSRTDVENELYFQALGLGDPKALAAAQEGADAYAKYVERAGLNSSPARELIRTYDMQAPFEDDEGAEEDENDTVIFHGAVDGNDMGRINTSVIRDEEDPSKLRFDEEGVNTMLLPLLTSWTHKKTGAEINGEPMMALVCSVGHLLQHAREHGLERVQFMLDYGDEHVDSHGGSYR